ncbi:hypothetical protein SORBI_3002G268250 [Sorghum bicolor]|uniref:Uncharacterized protein n=1 Tax=Sorghum bicolor TaxID=4558 RepID=A0A1W0W5Y7_SORBI|nr:hypothetical protein SORBI_3002G268250 [Sorghum bicolor]
MRSRLMTVTKRKCVSMLTLWTASSMPILVCSVVSQNLLYNVCFAHLLNGICITFYLTVASSCTISLSTTTVMHCRGLSPWKIQAQDSKLSLLELGFCCLGKLEELNLMWCISSSSRV